MRAHPQISSLSVVKLPPAGADAAVVWMKKPKKTSQKRKRRQFIRRLRFPRLVWDLTQGGEHVNDSLLPGPPAWVREHRDGQFVPFDADKISRALFAASESLGRTDAFLARELADGVVRFLQPRK